MKIAFSDTSMPQTAAKGTALVILASQVDGGKDKKDEGHARLGAVGVALDKLADGALARAIEAARFKGAKGTALSVLAPAGLGVARVVVAGVGATAKLDALAAQAAGGAAYGELARSGDEAALFAVEPLSGARKLKPADLAANLAFGARLASYRFDKYRTKEKPEKKPRIADLTLHVKGAAAARRVFAGLDAIADGVFFTRDLVSEPGNVIYPETLTREAQKLTKLGIKVDVLDEKKCAIWALARFLASPRAASDRRVSSSCAGRVAPRPGTRPSHWRLSARA